MSDLESVATQLEEARVSVESKLAEAEEQVRSHRAELSRIEAALQALRGKAAPGKAKASGVKAEEVRQYILEVWKDRGKELSEADLKEEVKTRLKAQGKKLMGFGNTYPKALEQAMG